MEAVDAVAVVVDVLDPQLAKRRRPFAEAHVVDEYALADQVEDRLEDLADTVEDRVEAAVDAASEKVAPVVGAARDQIDHWLPRVLEAVSAAATAGAAAGATAGEYRSRSGDAVAVLSDNANPNKIDSFLERTIEYRPVVNQNSGEATATLVVSLTNTAPTTGYDDYVIGNRVDLPIGTNRTFLDVSTRLGVDAARVDGKDIAPYTLPELGYNVHSSEIIVPPGETVVVEFELSGNLGRGAYQLAYRPQPLPNPDTLIVDARTTGGDQIMEFDGVLERRSVLSADGVRAWR